VKILVSLVQLTPGYESMNNDDVNEWLNQYKEQLKEDVIGLAMTDYEVIMKEQKKLT
jgi:hypothetical protein